MGVVSVRVKPVKTSGGQRGHDERRGRVPAYVDKERSVNNRLIVGSFDSVAGSKAAQALRYKEKTGREPRKDGVFFISGIITFDKEARDQVNSTPPDKEAEAFVKTFCEERKIKPLYIVRHSDESTNHYHFMLENIDENGKSVSAKLDRTALSDLQDKAGDAFSSVGLERGKKKVDRIRDGEPESAYIHRSVKELHEDLPAEIERARASLDKNARLAKKKREELAALSAEEAVGVERAAKLRHTLEAYERREKDQIAKIRELEKAYKSMSRTILTVSASDMPGALGSKEKAAEKINARIESFVRPIMAENEALRAQNRNLEAKAVRAGEVPSLDKKIKDLACRLATVERKITVFVDYVKSHGTDWAVKFFAGLESYEKKPDHERQNTR